MKAKIDGVVGKLGKVDLTGLPVRRALKFHQLLPTSTVGTHFKVTAIGGSQDGVSNLEL